jgi:hypothetical protein
LAIAFITDPRTGNANQGKLASTPFSLEIAAPIVFRSTGAACFGSLMIFSPFLAVVCVLAEHLPLVK